MFYIYIKMLLLILNENWFFILDQLHNEHEYYFQSKLKLVMNVYLWFKFNLDFVW